MILPHIQEQLDAEPEPPTSKNGAARASLILILVLVLGVAASVWLVSGMSATVALIVSVANVVLAVAAFILAVLGLMTAFRRPTKKLESVFALVLSTMFLVYVGYSLLVSLTATGIS